MRKIVSVGIYIGLTASAFGQGVITFYNNNIIDPNSGATYRAGIFRYGNVGAGAGFSAGLFLASDLSTPLATTTFRTANNTEVFANTQDVTIPGVMPGQTANLVIAAWTTAAGSYLAAKTDPTAQYGQQAFTSKPLGGPNPNPPPPSFFTPDIAPFTGFEMVAVPEPSTIALGVLGVGALLLRRRK